jgi:hypothetical protein
LRTISKLYRVSCGKLTSIALHLQPTDTGAITAPCSRLHSGKLEFSHYGIDKAMCHSPGARSNSKMEGCLMIADEISSTYSFPSIQTRRQTFPEPPEPVPCPPITPKYCDSVSSDVMIDRSHGSSIQPMSNP